MEDCPYCGGFHTVSVQYVNLEHPNGIECPSEIVYPSFFTYCDDCLPEWITDEDLANTEAALASILEQYEQ